MSTKGKATQRQPDRNNATAILIFILSAAVGVIALGVS